MSAYATDLELALRLADVADQVTLARFQALDLVVETKPDLTPVSDADRATEAALRDLLRAQRPDDGVLGEEMGGAGVDATGGRQWVLDPIDGTKNYVRGLPVWATLVALVDGGRPVVGVVSAPALGRRWWGSLGGEAFVGGALVGDPRPLRVSEVSDLADASLSYSDSVGWPDGGDAFRKLAAACWRTRAYGDFWSHVLVAEGAVDVAVEPDLNVWDVAALVPVVEAAGGTMTAWTGGDVLRGPGGLTTNGRVHGRVVDALVPRAG